jgi:hypothetical protein
MDLSIWRDKYSTNLLLSIRSVLAVLPGTLGIRLAATTIVLMPCLMHVWYRPKPVGRLHMPDRLFSFHFCALDVWYRLKKIFQIFEWFKAVFFGGLYD